MKIKTELEKLKTNDIYSLLMFVLFKVKDIPEYSTLSELCYILDKDDFLKLCEYFGGMTIKIPKIEDVEYLIYSLLMYQQIDIDGENYDSVMESMSNKSIDTKKIKNNYTVLKEVLKEYTFVSRK